MIIVQPPDWPRPRGYSNAMAARGLQIFVAGQVAIDPQGNLVGQGDIREQTEQVFRNLAAVLQSAGSGMEKVGKLTVLTTRVEHRVVIHEIRSRIFGAIGHFPASTLAVGDAVSASIPVFACAPT